MKKLLIAVCLLIAGNVCAQNDVYQLNYNAEHKNTQLYVNYDHYTVSDQYHMRVGWGVKQSKTGFSVFYDSNDRLAYRTTYGMSWDYRSNDFWVNVSAVSQMSLFSSTTTYRIDCKSRF